MRRFALYWLNEALEGLCCALCGVRTRVWNALDRAEGRTPDPLGDIQVVDDDGEID